ncbi:ankyrin repeat protein, putative [Trichomonas vaginalis G3]|uniref:Ankyrin repeat protein, putative n=1 Tax=Trichomonas vaginalis (strain ATCC PRA-98 / G3) TaxID=412133 RepID=A2DM07_TRIV3|nr:ankyrin repeat and SOCS box-containing protein 4 family [Trichomonas vaginalis G3]EAY18610.1 ankyrin repeat protein, putative [Trichomonas vaginalis G3]KAI5491646.1 ankyrin repeat and SOCS box-containing protein 4 family [Trichomonas vaginalis G3]|eukprot:XP_001579596.1 ankyrin repeat protein [Trichomonas vaginalis G3]
MSDQDIQPNRYDQLRNTFEYYIDSYNALYQLKTQNEEDLYEIYKMLKTELIDSKKYLPQNILKDILDIIPYNNRYSKSYLTLAKFISDDYHVHEVSNANSISIFLFYKEYGIKLGDFYKFRNLDILTENTICRAIMDNDLKTFISFTEKEGFDKKLIINSSLYPITYPGYSLLELCCYYGSVDCFKLLRTKFKSKITETCLELSFLGGNPEIMSECLKYKTPNKECMEKAIISHNIDFVTFLMNEYNTNIDLSFCGNYNNLESFLVYFDQTNDVNNCFFNSLKFDIPSLCEYFLSLGANINSKDEFGVSPLRRTAEYNSKETAEFLISHGADINEKDKDGQTVLHTAARYNSKETAEILISHGANINEREKEGKTILHIAALNNSKETAELLLSHGANINDKDKYGLTALHIAAMNNNIKTAEILLSHGANINDKDTNGKTALHVAANQNNKETAEILISHGADLNEKDFNEETALHAATLHQAKEVFKLLVLHGANINEKDKSGKTALHNVARFNNNEMAEMLISHGANINQKNKYEQTVLHIAACNNSKEIAELLVSLGANINEKDKNGKTPLHRAAEYNSKEVAEVLISHGANINETDIKGKTALHYATENNSKRAAEVLISHGANINEKDVTINENTAIYDAPNKSNQHCSFL